MTFLRPFFTFRYGYGHFVNDMLVQQTGGTLAGYSSACGTALGTCGPDFHPQAAALRWMCVGIRRRRVVPAWADVALT